MPRWITGGAFTCAGSDNDWLHGHRSLGNSITLPVADNSWPSRSRPRCHSQANEEHAGKSSAGIRRATAGTTAKPIAMPGLRKANFDQGPILPTVRPSVRDKHHLIPLTAQNLLKGGVVAHEQWPLRNSAVSFNSALDITSTLEPSHVPPVACS
jgi:hypothetical protein